MKKNIVIVGLGLIGSSLARSLRVSGVDSIIGVDIQENTRKAMSLGICDMVFGYDEVHEWKQVADMVMLCTPVDHILSYAREIMAAPTKFKPGVIITDVGSTKATICGELFGLFGSEATFVGGHPMAGSEKTGIDGGVHSLFESAIWILCPPPGDADYSPLYEIVMSTGGIPMIMDPVDHDRRVARISHFPQLMSSLISSTAGEIPESIEIAGSGFRDMSRLSMSSYEVWSSILDTNRENVLESLVSARNRLDALVKMFVDDTIPRGSMSEFFESGRDARRNLNAGSKQLSSCLCDIVLQLPDENGSISKAISPLSKAGIDIRDVELMKVRDGVSGTLRISLRNKGDAVDALSILGDVGIHGWMK